MESYSALLLTYGLHLDESWTSLFQQLPLNCVFAKSELDLQNILCVPLTQASSNNPNVWVRDEGIAKHLCRFKVIFILNAGPSSALLEALGKYCHEFGGHVVFTGGYPGSTNHTQFTAMFNAMKKPHWQLGDYCSTTYRATDTGKTLLASDIPLQFTQRAQTLAHIDSSNKLYLPVESSDTNYPLFAPLLVEPIECPALLSMCGSKGGWLAYLGFLAGVQIEREVASLILSLARKASNSIGPDSPPPLPPRVVVPAHIPIVTPSVELLPSLRPSLLSPVSPAPDQSSYAT